MNKIYQLISSIQLGGAENVAFELAEHCGNELHDDSEIVIVELYKSGNDYARFKKEDLNSKNIGVITLHKGSKRMSLILAPLKLVYLIVKSKPTIIHSHTDLPDFVLAVTKQINRLFRIKMPKIVRTIHNTQLWRSHEKMGQFTESSYGHEPVASVSQYAMKAYEQLREKYGLQTSNNRMIIYNGCVEPLKKSHPFHIEENKINIAFCGRFEDYKGVETIISTIPLLEQKFPKRFLFHLIGDGNYKSQLQELANQNNNILLYEPQPNVASKLYAFDYLWMPSHFEGLALMSIEASFSGIPVIVSFAPGLDETLPAEWPLKFHLNNKVELLDIFEKINNNQYDKEMLKEMSFNFVKDHFSRTQMISAYSKLYNNLI